MLFQNLATVLPFIFATANALPQARADKPAAFFLAGDSTTAVQSTGGGGWGNGFLNTTLKNGATGKNYGHNGATTVSFREGGDWATVLKAVQNVKADYTPYVTIQVSASRRRKLLWICPLSSGPEAGRQRSASRRMES